MGFISDLIEALQEGYEGLKEWVNDQPTEVEELSEFLNSFKE